ncbi:MAG TPA: nuclear transport factor 2 family protein [Capillimicrobium sp.]
MHSTTLTDTIDTYLAAYGEPDAAKRGALIAQAWAPDGQLVDPPLAAERHDGISEMAATMQAQFPGHRFRRSSGVDAHHEHARYAWELVGPDGAVAAAGVDVADVAPDGRLRRVVGFFGDLPARD